MAQRNSVVSSADSDEGYVAHSLTGSTSDSVGSCIEPKWTFVIPEDACLGTTKHTERIRNVQDKKLTEADVNKVSSGIGYSWRKLARELLFVETQIQEFQEERVDKERAHAMLIAFLQRDGSKATKRRLANALAQERVGRTDIAEILVGVEEFDLLKDTTTLHLTEEGHFLLGNPPNATRFTLCRNVDGQLYLVRPLTGTAYERACKTLTEENNLAENHLRALDPIGMVNAEKEKQQTEAKNRRFKEAHEKLAELNEKLKELKDEFWSQENREGHINVGAQVKVCSKMTKELHTNCMDLIGLTQVACQLDDPFPLKAKLTDHLIELLGSQNDLEGRILMLSEMASRDPALTEERQIIEKMLEECQMLGEKVRVHDSVCQELLEHEFSEAERTESMPPSQSRQCMRLGLPRRSSTQPLSESELRALTGQIRPREHCEGDE